MLGMRRFRHALVLGKFYPPHSGHHHLIRTAARASDRTTVAVLASTVESIPLADRVYWLAAEHWADPGVAVLGDLDDHRIDFDDDHVWELHVGVVRSVLARRALRDGDPDAAPVDVVFSSEKYGEELAARLGAAHVAVDPERVEHPVSSTAVRADPIGQWRYLAAATRAGLAARVVVLGAESTGTTTLAAQLAAHYRARNGSFADTRLVTEHGRVHTEGKLTAVHALAKASGRPPPELDSLPWTVGDFVDVARQQAIAEDDAAARGGPLLVCDNDSWAATCWCERYLGQAHAEVEQAAGDRRPALYLLTDHAGVPFEQDGWRDGEHRREWMTARFVRGLRDRGVPWVLVSGNPEHRLRRAVRACDEILRTHFRYAPPLGM
jgi:HTH-type transcriptional regulator, transcriptional repressor of NAD biosynthesis genes